MRLKQWLPLIRSKFKYNEYINILILKIIINWEQMNELSRDGIMYEKNVVEEIEDIFIKELGAGCSYVVEQNLREMGLSRETFQRADVDEFVSQLLKEYTKIIGNHIYILKREIEKRFGYDQKST